MKESFNESEHRITWNEPESKKKTEIEWERTEKKRTEENSPNSPNAWIQWTDSSSINFISEAMLEQFKHCWCNAFKLGSIQNAFAALWRYYLYIYEHWTYTETEAFFGRIGKHLNAKMCKKEREKNERKHKISREWKMRRELPLPNNADSMHDGGRTFVIKMMPSQCKANSPSPFHSIDRIWRDVSAPTLQTWKTASFS